MNIRKTVDYSTLFSALDDFMARELPQMELYQRIGEAICSRPEKGAAVAVSEYLQRRYPDAAGFSPRNVRRMRDLFRTYQNDPALMAAASKIGWTQNVVILEKCGSEAERKWYIRAVQWFGWSKQQLLAEIAYAAHTKIALDIAEDVCYTEDSKGDVCEQEKVNNASAPCGAVSACGTERRKEPVCRYQHRADQHRYGAGRRRLPGRGLSGLWKAHNYHPPPLRCHKNAVDFLLAL